MKTKHFGFEQPTLDIGLITPEQRRPVHDDIAESAPSLLDPQISLGSVDRWKGLDAKDEPYSREPRRPMTLADARALQKAELGGAVAERLVARNDAHGVIREQNGLTGPVNPSDRRATIERGRRAASRALGAALLKRDSVRAGGDPRIMLALRRAAEDKQERRRRQGT